MGVSSGRVLAGRFTDGRLHWDILDLWREVQDGMRTAVYEFSGHRFVSIGVDSWGVDFGLLGPHDELLGNPIVIVIGARRG